MSTETQIPEIYAALTGQSDTLRDHTTMLAGIHQRLEGVPERRTPFRIQVPGAPANTLSVALMSANRGEILTLQNPTAAPITVDLVEDNGALGQVLKVTVPANDYKALFIPFFGRLFARAPQANGAGMIVSGNVYD